MQFAFHWWRNSLKFLSHRKWCFQLCWNFLINCYSLKKEKLLNTTFNVRRVTIVSFCSGYNWRLIEQVMLGDNFIKLFLLSSLFCLLCSVVNVAIHYLTKPKAVSFTSIEDDYQTLLHRHNHARTDSICLICGNYFIRIP